MRLKELRLKRGITQKELAKVVGVTGQTLLNWENEIFEPSISQLIALADFFNVTIDYLLERPLRDFQIEDLWQYIKNINEKKFLDFIKQEINEMKKKQ